MLKVNWAVQVAIKKNYKIFEIIERKKVQIFNFEQKNNILIFKFNCHWDFFYVWIKNKNKIGRMWVLLRVSHGFCVHHKSSMREFSCLAGNWESDEGKPIHTQFLFLWRNNLDKQAKRAMKRYSLFFYFYFLCFISIKSKALFFD